jgi:hypothetical protein
VAGFALDFLRISVDVTKSKISLRMVEGLLIDRGDVLHAPLMVGMALLALVLVFEAPVKALFVIDVFADVFVAIKAERALGCLIESFMARDTGFFPFGMPFNHLSRHQGNFDGVRSSEPRQKEREQGDDGAYGVSKAHGSQRFNIWGGHGVNNRHSGRQEINEWNAGGVSR